MLPPPDVPRALADPADPADPPAVVAAVAAVAAEREIGRLHRALRISSAAAAAVIHATDEEALFERVCRAVVEAGSLPLAWIGLAEPGALRRVRPVAVAGGAAAYLDGLRVSWGHDELGRGPAGTAIRERRSVVCHDTGEDVAFGPWREAARAHGLRASLALPMVHDGAPIGALCLYASEPDAFDAAELELLQRLADEISFGLTSLRTAETLRTTELTQRAILEALPDAIFRIDADGVFTDYIPAQGFETYVPPGAFIGRHYRESLPPALVGPIEGALESAFDTGETSVVEYELDNLGEPRTYEARVVPRGVTEVVAVVRDVTDARRADRARAAAEENFRAVVCHSADAILVVDRGGRVRFGNPAAEELLGRSSRELLDVELEQLYDPCGPGRPGMVDLRRPDGSPRIGEVREADTAWEGQPVRLVTIRDVTDRVLLHEQLLQAQKLDTVGRLAAGVAHDFNNLITVIKANARFILEEPALPADVAGDAREIRAAADRAAALTRRLLAFGRKQPFQPRALHLGRLLRELDKLLGRLLGEDIELEITIAERVRRVRADPNQLEQVFTNLAVNARDAMPRGGRLRIHASNLGAEEEGVAAPGPGQWVCVRVSDDGDGMDDATLARALEPFFTTKAPDRGTGLGLSTAYGIVRAHDGALRIESAPGSGTTVTVLLPAVSRSMAPTTGPSAVPAAPRRGGTEHVLLVEDEEIVRRLARRMLTGLGYRVTEAASGTEALALVRAGVRPDLLLSDVIMPGMSGPELVHELEALMPALPVLFVSGYPGDVVTGRGALPPGVPLLDKPFTREGLAAALREALGR